MSDVIGKSQTMWNKYRNSPSIEPFPNETVLFNFTDIITFDMDTFLISYIESYPFIRSKRSFQSLWAKIAYNIFNGSTHNLEQDFQDSDDTRLNIPEKYLNNFKPTDELVFSCSFQRPFRTHSKEKCREFQYSLTNNGICYSFNGPRFSDIWKNSLITTTLDDLKVNNDTFENKYFRGTGESEGFQMLVNMKHYDTNPSTKYNFIPFTIGVSSKLNSFDQKRKIIRLKPGHHISIKVSTQIVETSEDFDAFDVQDRKCKHQHEATGFKYYDERYVFVKKIHK